MDKFSSKAAANPLPATNAAAGSMERDAPSPPAQAKTHPPEPAAVSYLSRPITSEYAAMFASRARAATRPPPVPQIGPPVGLTGTIGSIGATDDRDPAQPKQNNLAAALQRQNHALKRSGRDRQAQSRALMLGP